MGILLSAADVKDCMLKIETLKYAEEVCYNGTLIIKAFSSGLEIGSCNWSISYPKGSIAYISSSVFSSSTAMSFNYKALQRHDVTLFSDFSCCNATEKLEDDNSCSGSSGNAFSNSRCYAFQLQWNIFLEGLIPCSMIINLPDICNLRQIRSYIFLI